MPSCQFRQLLAPVEEQAIDADEQRTNPLLTDDSECWLQIIYGSWKKGMPSNER
jgi:hypothetical protein